MVDVISAYRALPPLSVAAIEEFNGNVYILEFSQFLKKLRKPE